MKNVEVWDLVQKGKVRYLQNKLQSLLMRKFKKLSEIKECFMEECLIQSFGDARYKGRSVNDKVSKIVAFFQPTLSEFSYW